jgi:predicted dehydrogenase
MSHRPTRRRFLQTTSSAGALLAIGVHSQLPAQVSTSANAKLNIGIVGAGGRGRDNMGGVSGENIVALCDVDSNNLASAKQQHPKATEYRDWRKLLEQKNIDAIVCSTADHTHAPCALGALRSGRHVYCEKPIGHTVEEARLLREAYAKSKVATQMGTQIHAENNYRRVVELIQAGAIGPVREAHVWCGRTISPVNPKAPPKPVPANLDWDLWLGPAKDRPFIDGIVPGNLTWNRWWDFGNGVLGDMGSHLIDLAYWALELKHPTAVQAEGPPVDEFGNPPWQIITWDHPKTEKRPECQVKWYHHDKRPASPAGIDLNGWHIGVMFVGDDGQLVADYGRLVLLPEEKFKDFKRPEPTIPPSKGHYAEWIHAAKTGEPTLCNFEYSGSLIEHNLLGNVAYRTGQRLEWDAEELSATNHPDAERFIKKEYRKGWEIRT